MSYSLEQGKQANYIVTFSVSGQEQEDTKQKVLQNYAKDVKVPGFRPGKAPLSVVEKQVNPEYLGMAVYEQMISKQLHSMVEENKEIKFIGSPYAIDFKDGKDGTKDVTYTLDVYPEVEVTGKDWEKQSMKAIDVSVSAEDLEKTVVQFKKQYADYKDVEVIGKDIIAKASYVFLDKEGKELHKSVLYVGNEEVEQHPLLEGLFYGKKKETFEVKYTKKDLPAIMHYTKDDTKPSLVRITVEDVKEMILPTFDKETIVKFFGDEAKVNSEEEILQMLEESMKQEKFHKDLMQNIEDMLNAMMKKTFAVTLPKTMVDQESEQRLKQMKERFGGDEAYAKYIDQVGEEKATAMQADVTKAAKESLQKFFVLQKYVSLLDLEVNWQENLDAEYKIYTKLTGEQPWKSEFLDSINAQ